MRRVLSLSGPLLLGCGELRTTDSAADLDTGPAPYVVSAGAAQVPDYDPDDLQQAVEAGLATLIGYDVEPVLDAYQELLSDTEASCPDWINSSGYLTWVDDCTTSQGTSYDGRGLIVLDDAVDFGDGALWQQRGIYMLGEVADGEGNSLFGTGTVNHFTQDVEYHLMTYQALSAGTVLTGEFATAGWESGRPSPEFGRSSVAYKGVDAHAVALNGRIELDGETVDMLAVDGFILIDETVSWGSNCALEPSGTLSVRTTSGVWLDMSFDGPTWTELADPALCDGCADAWADGQRVEELCFDFAPLLDVVEP